MTWSSSRSLPHLREKGRRTAGRPRKPRCEPRRCKRNRRPRSSPRLRKRKRRHVGPDPRRGNEPRSRRNRRTTAPGRACRLTMRTLDAAVIAAHSGENSSPCHKPKSRRLPVRSRLRSSIELVVHVPTLVTGVRLRLILLPGFALDRGCTRLVPGVSADDGNRTQPSHLIHRLPPTRHRRRPASLAGEHGRLPQVLPG